MRESPDQSMSRTHQHLVAGALCFVFFLLVYGITARGKLQTSDEAAVFTTGVSLATQGDLAIDELEWLNARVNIGQKGPDGHLYTKYFPGNIFSVAFIYKFTARAHDQPYVGPFGGVMEFAPSVTGARWAMKLNALWGALGLTALLFLWRRHFDWRTAIVSVVLAGLCSDWWYQSRGLFSEVGAGAFVIASFCFASYGRAYGSALALTISIFFRPTNLLALPVWSWTAWRKGPRAFLSGFIIAGGIALLAFYNWTRFGSPLNFGYGDETFDASPLRGLYGIFLSPGRSIFVYSPVLLLAIPGAWFFYKREKALTLLGLSFIAVYGITIAFWHSWDGGLSWGSRLLTPIVPVLGIFVAPMIERCWRNKALAAAAILLALMGVGVQTVALLRTPTRVMIDEVASGKIKYEETLYTVRNSWLALQVRSLANWNACDLDSETLHSWVPHCP